MTTRMKCALTKRNVTTHGLFQEKEVEKGLNRLTIWTFLVILFAGQCLGAEWITIDRPGASTTIAIGIDGGKVVGEADGQGFVYHVPTDAWTSLNFPGAEYTSAFAIEGGNVVGYYVESGAFHGFLHDMLTNGWTTIDLPGDTYAFAIDAHIIVGCYGSPGAYKGFLYDYVTTAWTTLEAPGAVQTYAEGIDGGTVVGYGEPAVDDGWLYDIGTGTFTRLYGPTGGFAYPFDIKGGNIVGSYDDEGRSRGFLYDGTSWTDLDFPGADTTWPCGIDGRTIVGFYHDPSSHGFIYTFNQPPVAICQDVLVAVGADGYADASVDGGSYDPDEDDIVCSQNPAGPYPVGVYNAELTVADPYGASDSCQAMLVVYDPSGGFVTGGGWIDSPASAYAPDPSLAGKANFGFVSKYKKGVTVPTGQTEFVFQAGDLNFHSSSYEWLVVTGSDYARFKGAGTINGFGDYKFMLWAGDKDPDTFRIRIWQEDEITGAETDIYDNGFDQEIGGGSIVVHAK